MQTTCVSWWLLIISLQQPTWRPIESEICFASLKPVVVDKEARMFDKLQNLNKLRKMQEDIKKELEQIFVQYQKDDIFILIRGDKKIERVEINGTEDKALKDAINTALKEVDKKVEKNMRGKLSELGFPNLGI